MAELTASPRRSASEAHGAPPALTDRFRAAVGLAQEIHGHQRRPGTETPYLAHLLVVTGLVLGDGGDGDEDPAIGHAPRLGRRRRRASDARANRPTFGARVAAIVAGCSDTVDGHPTGRWIERKRRYLRHLATVDDDAILRVALADKAITRALDRPGLPLRRACAVRLSPSPVGQERIRWCHEGVIGRQHHVDRTGPMNPA